MTTFTIDEQNNITAFGSAEEAAAATATPFDTFSSQVQLAELVAGWSAERLVTLWNSLPGVTPVKRFKNSQTAASRIWNRIQGLGEAAQPPAERKANGGARSAQGTPAKRPAAKVARPAKAASKAKKAAQAKEAAAPREGSKTAQVIALLQRKNGVTLAELMQKMGWQAHTVRGLMAGSLKKAGYQIGSFKSDKGDRTYKIG